MKTILTALVAAALAVPAFAGEAVNGKNYYVRDAQAWPTGEKTGYWRVTNTGISTSLAGPLDTTSIVCVGGGFYGPDGATGQGVCTFGEGDNTRTITWDHQGSGGTWELVHGTGEWAGITGSGTYKSMLLSQTRAITEWEGEVTLP